jgi:3-methyladenine DNA glycosylase AlkC
MGEPVKNIFNEEFFNEYTKLLKTIIDDFDEKLFLSQIIDEKWEDRGIVDRGRHLTTTLKKILPSDYKTAIAKILELINHIKETPYWSKVQDTKFGLSLEYGFLGGYVEQYGLDDYKTSIESLRNHSIYKL